MERYFSRLKVKSEEFFWDNNNLDVEMSTRMILRSKGSKDNPNTVSPVVPAGTSLPPETTRFLTPPKFWTQDPTVLFRNFAIVPNAKMTEAERFNAMTRLILIIALILFFVTSSLLVGLPTLWYNFTRRII